MTADAHAPRTNQTSSLLVLGGARSGKSRYAEQTALELSSAPVYLATSRVIDADHQARIERHQKDRGQEWRTVEEEKHLSRCGLRDNVVVVDCVTLWLSNFFMDLHQDVDRCVREATHELDQALAQPNRWIFVSNEIGQGVHAESEAGRKFTDLQGFVNQEIAKRVDAVALMVAGIPHYVKGVAPSS